MGDPGSNYIYNRGCLCQKGFCYRSSSSSPPAKPSQQMHCVCSRCLLPLKMCKTYERIMYDASTFYTSSALEEKRQILVSLSSGLCLYTDTTCWLVVKFISHKFHFIPLTAIPLSLSYNLKPIQQAFSHLCSSVKT